MEKAVNAGGTTQLFSLDSKEVTKICPEPHGLTASMTKDARGCKYLFVIVI